MKIRDIQFSVQVISEILGSGFSASCNEGSLLHGSGGKV